ncbi:MAG: hypothetical protein V4554_10175 [Pseudomonadota bacterium]
MPRRLHLTRSHAILRIKRRLEQDSFPRIQMSLIVCVTGAAGLLFSFLMLDAGVTSMALRYPLALLMAYGVFLVLLWLWLRTKAEDYVDIPDFSGSGSSGSGDCTPAFDGGGALSYALYRRIKATDSPHWVESAVRRTAPPFVLTAAFVSATGAAMAAYAPGAHSIGQVVQHTQTKQ